jgi:hypothetical protein
LSITRRALPVSVRSMRVGRPTSTVVLTPISVLMRCCSFTPIGLMSAEVALAAGQQFARTCSSSSAPFARDDELVLARQLAVLQHDLLDLGGNTLTPRMISMSSLRPTILPMRRMLRAVGGSRRVRSRVR